MSTSDDAGWSVARAGKRSDKRSGKQSGRWSSGQPGRRSGGLYSRPLGSVRGLLCPSGSLPAVAGASRTIGSDYRGPVPPTACTIRTAYTEDDRALTSFTIVICTTGVRVRETLPFGRRMDVSRLHSGAAGPRCRGRHRGGRHAPEAARGRRCRREPGCG